MAAGSIVPFWDERYAAADFFFGEAPNAFLKSQAHRLQPGRSVLRRMQ